MKGNLDPMSDTLAAFHARIHVLMAVMLLWSGLIVYRLVDLQIVKKAEFSAETENLHHSVEDIPAARGEILDANGKILAISREEPYIFADPSRIEDPAAASLTLSKVLGKDRAWRKRQEKLLSRSDKIFSFVARRVSETTAEKVRALDLAGIHIGSESWRTYPNHWIASHVVGFINSDESVKEGVEAFFNSEIGGKPGKREVLLDGRRRRNGLGGTIIKEPVIGASVQLTLDVNIQFFVENTLRRHMKITRAKNISAVVVDPRDGAILAMANMPDFNPNLFNKYRSYDRKNRAVVDVYEPASAFKIVTVAAALDSGAIDLDDVLFCENGGIRVFDTYIKDHQSFGNLSIEEMLWHSSNVGAIKVAQRMKPKVFAHYIQAFGFGEKTGVDLPAESAGIFSPVSSWTRVSHAFLAIGHEISVTPLQMLMAASVIANRGMLVQPYIAEGIVYADGGVRELASAREEPRRVIRERTAEQMVMALRGVVEQGTARAAQLPGVQVFGKTGTAQRLWKGSYAKDKFNASFVGFFPLEQPRYGMIVVVHDPKGKVHGGDVAAPIFSEIGRQILLYENARLSGQKIRVPFHAPNWPSRALAHGQRDGVMPNLMGLGLRNLIFQCQSMGLKVSLSGRGKVAAQEPPPGSPIPANRVCKVRLKKEG